MLNSKKSGNPVNLSPQFSLLQNGNKQPPLTLLLLMVKAKLG